MDEPTDQLVEILHEAAETHHAVYRIVDGEDADWASWTPTGWSGCPDCRPCWA